MNPVGLMAKAARWAGMMFCEQSGVKRRPGLRSVTELLVSGRTVVQTPMQLSLLAA